MICPYVTSLLLPVAIFLSIFIVLVMILRRRAMRESRAIYDKSWANQQKMIDLLTEIRDLLRKP